MTIKSRLARVDRVLSSHRTNKQYKVLVCELGESDSACLARYGNHDDDSPDLYIIIVKFCESNPEVIAARENDQPIKGKARDAAISRLIDDLQGQGYSMEDIANEVGCNNKKPDVLDVGPIHSDIGLLIK